MDIILVMNPYKVGYKTFATIGITLGRGSDVDAIETTLQRFPGVVGLVMVSGRYDFLVEYVCQDLEEYRKFITYKLKKVSGITNAESFIGLDLYERKFELGIIR